MAELVAGVDGCKRGWVAVVLIDGRFREARLIEGVESSLSELADMQRIAIDIPIGYGPRAADGLARAVVGGSSVFSIPERERFEAPFAEGGGISAQAHALGDRIRHVTDLAAGDKRLREVHPEVCFAGMNGMKRLKFRKKSAGGAFERLGLLRRHGINIDREPSAPRPRSRSTISSTRPRARGPRHAATRYRCPTRPSSVTGWRSRSGTEPPGPRASGDDAARVDALPDLARQVEQLLQVGRLGSIADDAASDGRPAVNRRVRRIHAAVELELGHHPAVEPVEVGVVDDPVRSVPEAADRE